MVTVPKVVSMVIKTFFFDLVCNIIPDNRLRSFDFLEGLRKKMSYDYTMIAEDFGAGPEDYTNNFRNLGTIARSSSKSPKYCRLLYRIVNYLKPAIMIELGTAVGMSAMYIAKGNLGGKLFTIEGNTKLARMAEINFKTASLTNINLITGKFEDELPALLKDIKELDFIYIDGNHRLTPTLAYFELCLEKSHKNTIFVFDDINWSEEMQDAWRSIKNHTKVTVTIDLFMMGLVFLNPDFSKQDFIIRY